MTSKPSLRTRLKLLDYIEKNPGVLQIELCKQFNYKTDTVRLYVAYLTKEGLADNRSNFVCIDTRVKHKELYAGHVYG